DVVTCALPIYLAQPGARPGAHEREVVRDLVERDGDDLEHSGELYQSIPVSLRLEGVGRLRDLEAGRLRQLVPDPLRKLRVGVESGAGGRAAERDLAHPGQR